MIKIGILLQLKRSCGIYQYLSIIDAKLNKRNMQLLTFIVKSQGKTLKMQRKFLLKKIFL